MDYGFAKFECKKLVGKDEEVQQIPLNKSGDKYYIAKAKDDIKVTIEKGTEAQINKKVTIDPNLKSIKEGDIVGICEVYIGDTLVSKTELYSDREVKQSQFLNNLKNIFTEIFDHAI